MKKALAKLLYLRGEGLISSLRDLGVLLPCGLGKHHRCGWVATFSSVLVGVPRRGAGEGNETFLQVTRACKTDPFPKPELHSIFKIEQCIFNIGVMA